MKTEIQRQHQRDFLELEQAIKSRVSFLSGLGFSEDEQRIRKQEANILLSIIENIRDYRLKPLKESTTVHGLTYHLDDHFFIPGNEDTTYKIIAFPDKLTIRGKAATIPAIGMPYTVEVYIEQARKVEKKEAPKIKTQRKTVRVKKEKQPKKNKVKIKVGDYYSVLPHGTIYKVIEVTKNKVIGINKLQKRNRVKTKLKNVIPATKKDYKKQHKIN